MYRSLVKEETSDELLTSFGALASITHGISYNVTVHRGEVLLLMSLPEGLNMVFLWIQLFARRSSSRGGSSNADGLPFLEQVKEKRPNLQYSHYGARRYSSATPRICLAYDAERRVLNRGRFASQSRLGKCSNWFFEFRTRLVCNQGLLRFTAVYCN